MVPAIPAASIAVASPTPFTAADISVQPIHTILMANFIRIVTTMHESRTLGHHRGIPIARTNLIPPIARPCHAQHPRVKVIGRFAWVNASWRTRYGTVHPIWSPASFCLASSGRSSHHSTFRTRQSLLGSWDGITLEPGSSTSVLEAKGSSAVRGALPTHEANQKSSIFFLLNNSPSSALIPS